VFYRRLVTIRAFVGSSRLLMGCGRIGQICRFDGVMVFECLQPAIM